MKRLRLLLIAITVLPALGALALVAAYWMLPVNLPLYGTLFGAQLDSSQDRLLAERITLPPGFAVNVFASGIAGARDMQLTPDGDILVAAIDGGEIMLVRGDADGDGHSDQSHILISNLQSAHGLLLEDDRLFVAEEHQLVRFAFDSDAPALSGKTVIIPDLPANDGHFTRTVGRGPDGALYVTIGSSCNACVEEHPWRAAMIRLEDAATPEIYASGLRNTVDFDWQPGTNRLYGVDNGRDWLGDTNPPDELNHIVEGGFYGWPYYNGDNVPDPDLGDATGAREREPIPPVHSFDAHVAPLGLVFLRDHSWPGFANSALAVLHGSWNSSVKVGYKIVRLEWRDDGTIVETPFATGFEIDEDVIGRPVDAIEAPGDVLYVSDDFADVIYRITYETP